MDTLQETTHGELAEVGAVIPQVRPLFLPVPVVAVRVVAEQAPAGEISSTI